MKPHLPLLAAALLMASAVTAQARPDPVAKATGPVVHLFGPGSVTATLLPAAPAASPAPGSPAAPAHPAPAAGEPGWGAALHQLFVTGDPSEPPAAKFSRGRASDD